MALVVLGCEVKDVPIKPAEIEFDKDGKTTAYVDSDGQKVKKIQVQPSQYKWLYENGTEYTGKAYKSIKGKPVKEFSKTTLIDKYESVDKTETQFYTQNEHTYLLVSEPFKAKFLQEVGKDKAMAFKYVIRGFKIYRAVISYEEELGGKLLMRCFRGDLRKADLTEKEDAKEIKSDDGVEGLDLDSIEV